MLAEAYRVLQVPYGAEMPQIRQAYRRLVLQYHPDRNAQPGAHEKFLQVQAAYEYLQRFQELGISPFAQASPQAPPPPAEPTPEEEWEMYQYVYEPPRDPKAHAAWARVAKERVRRQNEKDQAAFVRKTMALKTKWWYQPARIASYFVMVLGCQIALLLIILPFLFLQGQNLNLVWFGLVFIPLGIRILFAMETLAQDTQKHFGEDLPPARR